MIFTESKALKEAERHHVKFSIPDRRGISTVRINVWFRVVLVARIRQSCIGARHTPHCHQYKRAVVKEIPVNSKLPAQAGCDRDKNQAPKSKKRLLSSSTTSVRKHQHQAKSSGDQRKRRKTKASDTISIPAAVIVAQEDGKNAAEVKDAVSTGVHSLRVMLSRMPASQKGVAEAKAALEQKHAEVEEASAAEQNAEAKLADVRRELAAVVAGKERKESDVKALRDALATKQEKVAMIDFYKSLDEDGYRLAYQHIQKQKEMCEQLQCIVCQASNVYDENGHALVALMVPLGFA